MNVLLVTNLFPTPAEPTRGVFTGQLARELAKRCRLSVVCPLPWFPRWLDVAPLRRWGVFSRVPDHYWIGGQLVCSPKYAMLPKLSEAVHPDLMFPSLWDAVRRLHRLRPVDVVNAKWLYPDGVAAARVAERLGAPLVLSASGCDVNLFLGQAAKRRRILDAVDRAAAVTAVSAGLRDRLEAEGVPPGKTCVIPNGVDAGTFRPRDRAESRRALGLPEGGRRILFAGQLVEVKGVVTLVEAFARLDLRGAELALVGEGPVRAACERAARRLGVRERVRFAGAQPHDRVALWMGASDVFCLPSLREGWPNVVTEALASGLPVAGTRVGGIPEMVAEGVNGALAAPSDAASLAAALSRVLSREWDPSGVAATVSSYSWSRAAERYLEVFEKARNAKLEERREVLTA
jgi:teichuronic acid biosynthesis glycosyltransferase TuaC